MERNVASEALQLMDTFVCGWIKLYIVHKRKVSLHAKVSPILGVTKDRPNFNMCHVPFSWILVHFLSQSQSCAKYNFWTKFSEEEHLCHNSTSGQLEMAVVLMRPQPHERYDCQDVRETSHAKIHPEQLYNRGLHDLHKCCWRQHHTVININCCWKSIMMLFNPSKQANIIHWLMPQCKSTYRGTLKLGTAITKAVGKDQNLGPRCRWTQVLLL